MFNEKSLAETFKLGILFIQSDQAKLVTDSLSLSHRLAMLDSSDLVLCKLWILQSKFN